MGNIKNPDWESISREYRAGIRSLRDIGKEFYVTEGAIRKRAKKEQWPRDLSEKIKARAEQLVREEVRKEAVRSGTQAKDIIEDNASDIATVLIGHKKSAIELHKQHDKLLLELDSCGEDLAKRAKILKDLADVKKSIVEMDRKTLGLDKGINKDMSIGELLDSMS